MGIYVEATRAAANVRSNEPHPFLQMAAYQDAIPGRVAQLPDDRPWVRDLSAEENWTLRAASTGDMLLDGSVLLWLDDALRMNLEALRRWVVERVCVSATPIALGGLGFGHGGSK